MPRIEVYKDRADEWRWRKVADNGNVIAESGEGYKNKSHAVDMARQELGTHPAGAPRYDLVQGALHPQSQDARLISVTDAMAEHLEQYAEEDEAAAKLLRLYEQVRPDDEEIDLA
jgi:uncharacterized protein YegP (UPF0339 family)